MLTEVGGEEEKRSILISAAPSPMSPLGHQVLGQKMASSFLLPLGTAGDIPNPRDGSGLLLQ